MKGSFPARVSVAGMTLLEVLVAVSISSLLILALANILGKTSGIYADTEKTVETLRDGRAALGILRDDMAGLMGPETGLPVVYERNEAGFATRWGFFTSRSARAQEVGRNPGDLCFVWYYTAITTETNGRTSRKLFRKFISSADAIAILGAPNPPTLTPDPLNDDAIAFNVLDFRCEFRRRDETGTWVEVKSSEEIPLAGEVTVVLRVITNEAAASLESEADWSPGGTGGEGFDFDAEEDDDASARSFRARYQLER
jgi:prepilin-type N-terminal cleavage/methylation domain-containing protein